MTVNEEQPLNPETDFSSSLAWLHCNECHRAFEHHNKIHYTNPGQSNKDVTTNTSTMRIIKSDLRFAFTSCGHFYCEQCLKLHRDPDGGAFMCPLCKESAAEHVLDGFIPRKLEMYMKPPIALMEDALSVMMFQLTNANQLISSLRAKVSQQKELLGRAKTELANQKTLKERIKELEGQLQEAQNANPDSFRPHSATIRGGNNGFNNGNTSNGVGGLSNFKFPSRISLRSPSITSIQQGSVGTHGPLIRNSPLHSAITNPLTYQQPQLVQQQAQTTPFYVHKQQPVMLLQREMAGTSLQHQLGYCSPSGRSVLMPQQATTANSSIVYQQQPMIPTGDTSHNNVAAIQSQPPVQVMHPQWSDYVVASSTMSPAITPRPVNRRHRH